MQILRMSAKVCSKSLLHMSIVDKLRPFSEYNISQVSKNNQKCVQKTLPEVGLVDGFVVFLPAMPRHPELYHGDGMVLALEDVSPAENVIQQQSELAIAHTAWNRIKAEPRESCFTLRT